MGDVGLAIGDPLGFGAGRRAEDDHAGAEPVTGVVQEGTCADEHALGVDALGAIGRDGRRLRCHGGNALAIDQNLAGEGGCTRAVPYTGVFDQQSHRYSLPRHADHSRLKRPGD